MNSMVSTQWYTVAQQFYLNGINLLPIGQDKRPLNLMKWEHWQTHRQAWGDLQTFEWGKATGVAAICGRVSGDLVCVDIDRATDNHTALALLSQLGLPFDYQWLVKTGSGKGYHLWLTCPDLDLGSVGRLDNPGVKGGHIEIRHNGHYAILPPSQHPSGDIYTFINGIPTQRPAPVTSDYLLAAYRAVTVEKPKPAPLPPREDKPAPSGDDRARTYINRAIDNQIGAVARAKPGERNSLLYQSALKLGGFIGQGGLTRSELENDLLRAALASGLSESEAQATIKSGLDRANQRTIPEKPDHAGNDHSGEVAPAPTGEPPLNLTDLGNARRLIKLYGGKILYCELWEQWLVWDSTRWKLDQTSEVKRMAKATVKQIPLEATNATGKRKRRILDWSLRSESAGKLEAMVRVAQSEREVIASPEDFDSDVWMLNCQNCVVDLRTGATLPHDPHARHTKQVKADYDPHAQAPTWAAFLRRIMDNNDNLITFLQRAIGYSLTGATREQVVFFLYGKGANGKSTFLNALRFLLADYSKNTPTGTLMRKKDSGSGASDDLARLLGVRFVTAIETDENQQLSESTIKSLTGEDDITARHLYSGFFDFKPQLKIWLACNHKPVITGVDNGIWRRIRLIPFMVTIPENERDDDLPKKLEAEAAGILRWAIEGCLLWQAEKLGMPEEISQAVSDYRTEMDSLATFIQDECVLLPSAVAAAGDLFQRYQKWAMAAGEKVLTQRAFGGKLSERGFTSRRGTAGKHIWQGIGLKSDPSDPND